MLCCVPLISLGGLSFLKGNRGMNLGGGRGWRRELGGLEERETAVGMYCMRDE